MSGSGKCEAQSDEKKVAFSESSLKENAEKMRCREALMENSSMNQSAFERNYLLLNDDESSAQKAPLPRSGRGTRTGILSLIEQIEEEK